MNAIQFIQQNGVEKAREVVSASANALVQCKDGTTFHVDDLKRLVKSVHTVNSFGGLGDSKAVVKMGKYYKYLKRAIADYEAIYSDNDMGDDSHIENHVSPLCKMGVK